MKIGISYFFIETKTASKNFTEQVTILHQDLEDLERNIVSRANAPVSQSFSNNN